ncbi:carbohydrate ABC transporter permease [Occultella aeris]|uniref:Inner membrane ABC transporter permease protein YcjO n=1 Tax=Occultella aeris TaxID=2761496 RepID=A0A7M4DGZ5_9MICO|nr:sugar ABC transporter permease [Occultella aeris]VZO36188.1 Inner membrane ABC transporter permease protein YcjO [Occultella aeris]
MTSTDVRAGSGGLAPPAPARPARRRSVGRGRLVQVAFLIPAAVYLVLFFGYPVVKNITMGFQEYTTRTFYTGEAPWVGFANYVTALTDPVFDRALLNTGLFTVGSIVGQFTIGLLIALFFHRRFQLSGVLRSLLLLPWLVPMIAASAVWRWILDTDHGVLNRTLDLLPFVDGRPAWLTSTTLALVAVIIVNIWLGIPFNATILYGGLQEIPEELYEAGSLDGATGARAFRHITWPLLRPVVTVVLVLGVVYTLKVLDVILGLTNGGPANATQTIATFSYHMSFREFDFGVGAALGNILVLISLAFAIVYLRLNRRAIDE